MNEIPPQQLFENDLVKLKSYIIDIVSQLAEESPPIGDEYHLQIEEWVREVYENTNVSLSPKIKEGIFRDILADITGYGPIQILLDDPENSEIMVYGPKQVYVERKGKLQDVDVHFNDEDHLMRIINRMLHSIGKQVNYESPTADARLPDGSRLNVIIPPVSVDGPCITIRKFLHNMFTTEEYINLGSATKEMMEFLKACVVSRMNIIVSGNTSSGKTTLLNILTGFIPNNERIVTIEDAAELQLKQKYVVRLETKPPNVDGVGAVNTRDLVRNSLRMRPDRIIVGEARGREALDMLQSMNTGHDGSMTTLHANSPRDTISRLETMTLMSGLDLRTKAIRQQIASAVDLIVHMERLSDGTRKIVRITEVPRMEGDVVTLSDIFTFDQTGTDESGKILGEMQATGLRPIFTPRLEVSGFKLGAEIFGIKKM